MTDEPILCNQHECGEPAQFLHTWPGRDQAGLCEEHAAMMKRVSEGIGLHVQLISIFDQGPAGQVT